MSSLALKIPPMLVAAVTGALIWVAAQMTPALDFALPWRGIVAVLLIVSGTGIALLGVVAFRRARTSVNPLKPDAVSAFVVSGIYRWTRNPMYLGVLWVLVGWALYLGNFAALLFAPVFVWYLNCFQILPEEAVLRARFGAEFDSYRSRVRRWL